MTPVPSQTNVEAAVVSFLEAVLPGMEIAIGQENRVPEPHGAEWILVTSTRMRRLRTNVSSDADVRFTGSIAGTAMTVTDVSLGQILPGAVVFGTGVAANTIVVSGPPGGGPGSYVVAPSQTVGSEVLASGARLIEQGAEVAIQIDFHAEGGSGDSGDMAATVSTLFRDEFGTQQFADQSPNYGVTPLHADDPRQVPFVNEQQQVETVWTVDALVQANIVLSIPQQYAEAATVEVISVEATYPP